MVEGQTSEGGAEQDPEELMAQQIEQTNDMFVKFAIYDKVNELTEKLDYFQENFKDIDSDFYKEVLQLKEFLDIFSNLLFNLDTSVAYQMYGNILLQLTTLFQEYNTNGKIADQQQDAKQKQITSKLSDEILT
jgi:hypothetical protein